MFNIVSHFIINTFSYLFSEDYYSESDDDDEDNTSRGSSRSSTPSNIGIDMPVFAQGAEVGSAGNVYSKDYLYMS